jgi:hypothetical protein
MNTETLSEATTTPPQTTSYGARGCPSCAAPSRAATKVVGWPVPAEGRSFEELRGHWHGFFQEKPFFSYYRCSQCEMLYAPSYFTEEQLQALYASMPANMHGVADATLAATQYGYFGELRKSSPLSGGYLEIGPDVGLFLRHGIAEGTFSNFWLFEPNVDAHQALRECLGPREATISTALLDLSAVPDGSVDVMVMIHVLDHLIDPVRFLCEARPKLKSDAVVLIVTHNEGSLLARLLGPRWPAYCLQHPHLFTPTSMRGLLARAGLTVERTVRSFNAFPAGFLLEHLTFALGLGKPKMPAALNKLILPLRLGNFITIARVAESA